MVVTSDENVAGAARMLRNHGSKKKYFHSIHGYNSRLDTLQAALLSVKLKHLDEWNDRRRENASLYKKFLKDDVAHQKIKDGVLHSFNYYSIIIDDRDRVAAQLKERGIATTVYYPLCLHMQEVYRWLGYKKGDFPEAERLQDKILSLPMYSELKEENIKEVAEAVLS
jgi:dTDP-4-amino-4,6-dideoxygalactose transaminase